MENNMTNTPLSVYQDPARSTKSHALITEQMSLVITGKAGTRVQPSEEAVATLSFTNDEGVEETVEYTLSPLDWYMFSQGDMKMTIKCKDPSKPLSVTTEHAQQFGLVHPVEPNIVGFDGKRIYG